MLKEKYINDKLLFEIGPFKANGAYGFFTSRLNWDQENLIDDLERTLDLDNKVFLRGRQVHGTNIIDVKRSDIEEDILAEADGYITIDRSVVLTTYHADCTPIYYYDPKNEVIGLSHGGWKGTLNNIPGQVISLMVKNYRTSPEDLQVVIGPAICRDCYEVKEDLVEIFTKKYKDYENYIKYQDSKTYLDLAYINKKNIKAQGLEDRQIYLTNYCTACNLDKLYSYRKEKATKNRMIAGIYLK